MKKEKSLAIHPGEVLKEEFLAPLKLSQNALALGLRVPAQRINDIVHGKRAITVDTAARLSAYFGTSVKFWLNLQNRYDITKAEEKGLFKLVKKDVPNSIVM
jgi:addiction module HigA family antidote